MSQIKKAGMLFALVLPFLIISSPAEAAESVSSAHVSSVHADVSASETSTATSEAAASEASSSAAASEASAVESATTAASRETAMTSSETSQEYSALRTSMFTGQSAFASINQSPFEMGEDTPFFNYYFPSYMILQEKNLTKLQLNQEHQIGLDPSVIRQGVQKFWLIVQTNQGKQALLVTKAQYDTVRTGDTVQVNHNQVKIMKQGKRG